MRDDQATAKEMVLVESDSGPRASGGGADCHRGHGGEVVFPLAWDRAGDVMRRWADVEPDRLDPYFALHRLRRQVIFLAIRIVQWLVVFVSFLWVAWWT